MLCFAELLHLGFAFLAAEMFFVLGCRNENTRCACIYKRDCISYQDAIVQSTRTARAKDVFD